VNAKIRDTKVTLTLSNTTMPTWYYYKKYWWR